MKVFPIDDPVHGEQVLAVQPPIERAPGADWLQRLEYFSGRALTHSALNLEQKSRSGHLATLGQAVSPGVVTGLVATAAQNSEGVVIEVAPGTGMALSGEIVHINRHQQVMLDDIRVYAPAALLEGDGQGGAFKLGDTLGKLRAAGTALPGAMVLVLQPVTVVHFDQEPSTDPCDRDPTDQAFENWQWVDGCRVLLYAWDPGLSPLPVMGSRRRNRLAYAVFDLERGMGEGDALPWASVGVPIALIGLDSALYFAFIDRNAVVRRGGEAKGSEVPITPAGSRFLWQAQFEQFNEHLADWIMQASDLEPADIQAGAEFRRLPPVGVLPRETMEPRRQMQHFFPPNYGVRALAIPYEQLDLAIEESAGLLPYDLNAPDRVEVLVPVPQQHFDPRLLVVEEIGPEFDQAIARFTILRDQWLGRRMVVRKKASALYEAIKGKPLLYPADDPNAVDALEQPVDFEEKLVKRGDGCRYFPGEPAPPGNWMQPSFDDSSWDEGLTPLGYGTGGMGTSLEDMPNTYVTVFFRHRFSLDSLEDALYYSLGVTTQGGYYAYLNGRLLSSANVTGSFHRTPAAGPLPLEKRFYELGGLLGLLIEGENVLAIQAHSPGWNEETFFVSVELLNTEQSFGTTERPLLRQIKASIPFGEEQYDVDALQELRGDLEGMPLSSPEVDKVDELGIEAYIGYLQHKVDQANDRVDFGFLRLRTDMYRVRQLMLGNEAGTKLATSPALAEIAKGTSAVATKNELSDFYQRIKQAGPKTGGSGDGGEIPLSDSPSGGDGQATLTREASKPSGNTFFSGELSGRGLTGPAGRESAVLRDMVRSKKDLGIPGIQDPEMKFATMFEKESSSGALFKYGTASLQDVDEQNPVVGKIQDFNNVTVGERLEESSANVAYMAGLAVKAELLTGLLESDISIDDLKVPGVASDNGELLTFAQVRADKDAVVTDIMDGKYDQVPVDDDSLNGYDEAGFFNAGIKAQESVVAVLRLIEGRVQAYRKAISLCRDTWKSIQGDLNKADQRLKTIGDELAESRHDVTVARALKAEEQARIDALNEKRDKILQTLVPFVLFRRPRTVDLRLDAPVRNLDPDLSDQPLPLCDLSEVETPEAVAAMLDVVRDGPMKWFVAGDLILPHLSRLPDLHVTLANAKKRALSKVSAHPFLEMDFQAPDSLLQGLGGSIEQARKRVRAEREKTRAIDLVAFQRFGWQESIKRVPEVVSLGDLIDGPHGRMGASQRAAREMGMISQVATCLYVGFSQVKPALRLHWAERLSQFDQPVNLRNLYTLPRFSELGVIDRHNMQRLVDWLYGRIFSRYPEALQMFSDLIRVTLLSASHAPVNQLIAGYLPEPAVVRPGSFVNLVAELSRVRVGMALSLVSGGALVVNGRVADISGGLVRAEVLSVAGDSVQLESGARAQIGPRLGMRIT